ncbi:MAG TPA: hypothetical protein VJ770_02510 [Stellaceae bacterium]|nr:hypothetical protein [Stellaceae bacterium]
MARPRFESGTVLESLSEIRDVLRNLDAGEGGNAAPPEDGALARNALPPPAAPLPPRNAATAAALVVGGLAILGATNVAVVRGPDLAHLVAGAVATTQSRLGDGPEAVARAALPPAQAAVIERRDTFPPRASAATPGNVSDGAVPAQPQAAPLQAVPAGSGAAPSAADRSEGERLRQAGDAQLVDGDVASARLFYQRAADIGDAGAAFALGNSFDPAFLERLGVRGMRGDAATAARWYRRARALGDPYAAKALKALLR